MSNKCSSLACDNNTYVRHPLTFVKGIYFFNNLALLDILYLAGFLFGLITLGVWMGQGVGRSQAPHISDLEVISCV